ncbi:uncharacterized protein LOC101681444 [Mustela putorius furo]|uniref:Uncharacterized protein LOC101681444 n=1 Tax=Mustela putorius furo TaxID=9669 RepID=A0A8U0SX72_MUSPF|nr:uncharacterized protein LOC101681444 [Mustela putorius furo]
MTGDFALLKQDKKPKKKTLDTGDTKSNPEQKGGSLTVVDSWVLFLCEEQGCVEVGSRTRELKQRGRVFQSPFPGVFPRILDQGTGHRDTRCSEAESSGSEPVRPRTDPRQLRPRAEPAEEPPGRTDLRPRVPSGLSSAGDAGQPHGRGTHAPSGAVPGPTSSPRPASAQGAGPARLGGPRAAGEEPVSPREEDPAVHASRDGADGIARSKAMDMPRWRAELNHEACSTPAKPGLSPQF